jgi:hypothetical protein
MSDLAWKLARLRAMSLAEIAHRARIAGRDALAPPGYSRWTAGEAGARLFEGDAQAVWSGSRLASLVGAPDARSGSAEVSAARDLLAGRWRLFGREVRLDDPPRWSVNPVTGASWPDLPAARIDYHDVSVAGDPKLCWELGRLTALVTLALAHRVSREEEFANLAIRWLDDFAVRNPIGHGIHHSSGIEQAVRVIATTWTLALLGERAGGARLQTCLGLMAQQALHCRDHLSLGSSANNHLIAEYAGVTVLAAAFPGLRDSERLLREGLQGLEAEVLRQFDRDGVPLEQAFGYLPFVWELLLCAFLAAERAAATISTPVRERLRASLEFARWIRLPDGSWPRVGDEDDARILLAGGSGSRLDRVGNALAAWLGVEALSDAEPDLALLLQGQVPPARTAADGVLGTSGYTIWRERGLLVTFDHGPLGLPPLAAHGHADALSITIHRGTDAIVVDPGTFSYHADRAARDRCRSTPAHATLNFGGRSQAAMHGPFLWGKWPRVARASDSSAQSTPGAPEFICQWPSGEAHARRVSVESGTVRIEDRVIRGTQPEIVFPLAPGAAIELEGTSARVSTGGSNATFAGQGIEAWRIEPADVAPQYGRIVRAERLVARLNGSEARTLIRIAPR